MITEVTLRKLICPNAAEAAVKTFGSEPDPSTNGSCCVLSFSALTREMFTFAKQTQNIPGWQHLSQHIIGSWQFQKQMTEGKSVSREAPVTVIYHMCCGSPTGQAVGFWSKKDGLEFQFLPHPVKVLCAKTMIAYLLSAI